MMAVYSRTLSLTAGLLLVALLVPATAFGQQRDTLAQKPLNVDVNKIHWTIKPGLGDGGMSSQFSWNTVASKQNSEPFYYPADRYYGNMLFQLWNILNYSDEGYIDHEGERQVRKWRIMAGDTDWSIEKRRYRPPTVTVDGYNYTPPYLWEVDPDLPADYVAEFEDVHRDWNRGYGGFRNHVTIYANSNPNHQDYVIWKETRTFTGELRLPRETDPDMTLEELYLPDQTVGLWWTFNMGFGPTKGGERQSWQFFAYEGEDDKEDFFIRPSELVPDRTRKDLTVAYFWDDMTDRQTPYTLATGETSNDDTGDPHRDTGILTATQIPGFTVLYADKSTDSHVDDPNQPIAVPRGNINDHFFGQQDNWRMRDHWAGLDDAFPGPASSIQKGSMRGLVTGPYELTMERDDEGNLVHADSFTVVYAIGVGDVGKTVADSLGRAWFQGEITDAEKSVFIERGRDSLFQNLDRAYWTYANNFQVPAAPPAPDVVVTSGPGYNTVEWSYPEERYWNDANTGVDDIAGWRVYRKRGDFWVNGPDDNGSEIEWELVQTIEEPRTMSWDDDTVERGIPYYYAVTAVDDGTQNINGLNPGEKLESSRYANMTPSPAISFERGLNVSSEVRVVPNPASSKAGQAGFASGDEILFVNLPYKATLSIYTETGELIRRIDHVASADEKWDQRTDGNQFVTSGIYILAVLEAEDENGKALPDQFVKFVIVR